MAVRKQANGDSVQYEYDDQSLLTGQAYGNGDAVSFTYDILGRAKTTTYSDGRTLTYTYDGSGNPTSYYNGTRWGFEWEEGRRLVTANGGGKALTFTYDSDGLRLTKTVDGTTHNYLYASGKLLRETWGTNTLDFFYDESGHPYALKYNGTTYYYVTNLQGDVLHIVNGFGTPVVSYAYDPYGKPTITSDTSDISLGTINPLRYRGYVYDSETELYYLQSRYYDPTIGRFINADAAVATGQGLIGNNMYVYCGNNPVNRIDPTGNAWWIIPLLIVPIVLFGCTNETDPDSQNVNCYAYAMRLEKDPITGESFEQKPDPGAFSGNRLEPTDIVGNRNKDSYNIYNRVISDADALGYECYMVHSADHPTPEGGWQIAIAYTNTVPGYGWDYHFWRRDYDGTWSHKPGNKAISYVDFSGKIINDPKNCDRGIYDYWVGYFVILPKR